MKQSVFQSLPNMLRMCSRGYVVAIAEYRHSGLAGFPAQAEDVKRTCDCTPDSIVIASHMDTVTHAHLNREAFRKELAGTQYVRQVLIPEDGERIAII